MRLLFFMSNLLIATIIFAQTRLVFSSIMVILVT